MKILFEDKDKIILNKEAVQLVQSGRGFDLDLVSEVMNYRRKKGEPAYAAVINRLDRPVSGVVLMAKNKESAAKYSRIMQKQGFCKEYFAVVYGKMEEKKAVLSDYLIKTKDNVAEISDESCTEAKFAELEYEVMQEITLKNGEILSFLKITLHTGRFHQIRVQLASRGHAIVGDTKYGMKYSCDRKLERAADTNNEIKTSSKKTDGYNKATVDSQGSGQLNFKLHEIALCAHSLNVDDKEYQVTPPWWDGVTW
jgi:23S rRNA pseudouridine1911/1915/1917 synthase